jgi:hypothetical protein
LLRKISSADYIAFATPRAVDSIPRIPREYPRTTALLQLLWAEKLGFRLEKTFKNRPSLVGFEFNDDLADESFSVYDHPKVVVFKNVEHLLPEEMMIRIQSAAESGPLGAVEAAVESRVEWLCSINKSVGRAWSHWRDFAGMSLRATA